MSTLKRLQVGFIVVTLALTLSGCASLGSGGPVPEPINEYKWSQPMEAIMPDGEVKLIQCLTVEDKRRIDAWIELMKANNALSGR